MHLCLWCQITKSRLSLISSCTNYSLKLLVFRWFQKHKNDIKCKVQLVGPTVHCSYDKIISQNSLKIVFKKRNETPSLCVKVNDTRETKLWVPDFTKYKPCPFWNCPKYILEGVSHNINNTIGNFIRLYIEDIKKQNTSVALKLIITCVLL